MTDTQPIIRPGLTPLSTRTKATRGHTRLNNLRLALQIVYAQSPTSRADVARASRLTAATASALIDELILMGLVTEIGTGPSAGGKPPTLIAPNPNGRSIVALDLSSAHFQGALVDLAGEKVLTESAPSVGGDRGTEVARQLVSSLAAQSSAPLLGVGIGAPGVVDPESGRVTSANLGWHDTPLAEIIAEGLDAPIHIINDAHAATLREYSVHSPRASSFALVRVGRGVGSGFVLDGHLYRGDNAATGEVGHVRLDEGDKLCTCGNRGCLETEASMAALLDVVGGDQQLTPDRMAELAADPGAGEAIESAAVALGRGLAPMVALLAVGDVALWGEVKALGDRYLGVVEREIRTRVLPVNTDQIHVRYATAGDDAVLLGAAGLVLSSELAVVW